MEQFFLGFEKRAKEFFEGGKADGKPASDFPKEQLAKGVKIESEHTNNPKAAKEIAKDHLQEDKEKGINPPNYYDRLETIEKKGAELTAKGRNQIASGNFVFEKERRYPIHDISHARNALARVSQYGTSSEKAAVKNKVYEKYPSLKQ